MEPAACLVKEDREMFFLFFQFTEWSLELIATGFADGAGMLFGKTDTNSDPDG